MSALRNVPVLTSSSVMQRFSASRDLGSSRPPLYPPCVRGAGRIRNYNASPMRGVSKRKYIPQRLMLPQGCEQGNLGSPIKASGCSSSQSSEALGRSYTCPLGRLDPGTYYKCAHFPYKWNKKLFCLREHLKRVHKITVPRQCRTWEDISRHCQDWMNFHAFRDGQAHDLLTPSSVSSQYDTISNSSHQNPSPPYENQISISDQLVQLREPRMTLGTQLPPPLSSQRDRWTTPASDSALDYNDIFPVPTNSFTSNTTPIHNGNQIIPKQHEPTRSSGSVKHGYTQNLYTHPERHSHIVGDVKQVVGLPATHYPIQADDTMSAYQPNCGVLSPVALSSLSVHSMSHDSDAFKPPYTQVTSIASTQSLNMQRNPQIETTLIPSTFDRAHWGVKRHTNVTPSQALYPPQDDISLFTTRRPITRSRALDLPGIEDHTNRHGFLSEQNPNFESPKKPETICSDPFDLNDREPRELLDALARYLLRRKMPS